MFKRILLSTKLYSSLRNDDSMQVFSVFFHPDPSVSALGGAEKRFVETLKVFEMQKNVKITVVESQPSLLTGFGVRCEKQEVSNPISALRGGWVGIYVGWIMWSLKALIRCLQVAGWKKFDVVLAPNNTGPNLIPAYFFHHLSHIPLCVVVHHLDVVSPFFKSNFSTMYHSYRETGFGRSTSLLKALAFVTILALLKRCDICITVSDFTARALVNNGVTEERIFVSGNGVDMKHIDSFKVKGKG